ncbi:MAG: adenosine-specific kinase [Bryobacteraceae bacterium]
MVFSNVPISVPIDASIIFGQSHFIKTVEDVYEAIVNTNPAIKFGVAFNEASGPCLTRADGNDPEMIKSAIENLQTIGCGHTFLVVLKGGFPINVLGRVKDVPEVVNIFCATANPVEVVVATTGLGRGVMGVIDGSKPRGVETADDAVERKNFLRKIGYKR